MRISILLALFVIVSSAFGQSKLDLSNEPSSNYPFGKVSTEAPPQTNDFDPMIGLSLCTSARRNQDGTWQAPVAMQWKFTYIMNGMAVQDETLKSDGVHSGSIRQYNIDSARWYVHYYTTASANPNLSTWEGNMQEGKIILTMPQPAPNGVEGYSRLTFYELSEQSYKWLGEWVSKDETIIYPFWKIECTKVE